MYGILSMKSIVSEETMLEVRVSSLRRGYLKKGDET
jgi:hypothetical protein